MNTIEGIVLNCLCSLSACDAECVRPCVYYNRCQYPVCINRCTLLPNNTLVDDTLYARSLKSYTKRLSRLDRAHKTHGESITKEAKDRKQSDCLFCEGKSDQERCQNHSIKQKKSFRSQTLKAACASIKVPPCRAS